MLSRLQQHFCVKQIMIPLLALTFFMASSTAFAQATVHGVLKVVKGDVSIIGKDGKTAKAKLGGKVYPLDKIKTGANSRAKIVMIDNNEINISPDSMIEIKSYEFKPEDGKKNVVLDVMYGKLRAKVNQKYDGEENKFQVKTKSAVAGVRGTDFITGYDRKDNSTKIVTFEGKVQFGLPGANGKIENAVMVGVGQTTSVVGSAPPPPPVEVPKSELANYDKSSDAEKSAGGPGENSQGREPSSERGQKEGESTEDRDKGFGNDDKQASADAPVEAAVDGGSAPVADTVASDSNMMDPARDVASTTDSGMGGTMLLPEDMPSGDVVYTPPPSLDVLPPPTFLQPIYQPPPCDICNQLIEGKNATLFITVTPGP